jgi:HTH-type transcriptional regulator/antitoxin HipB
MSDINPNGNISSAEEIGALVRKHRKQNGWRIEDVSGIGNVGARFISEFERGKETAELGKVLKVLDVLGLEVVIRPRGQSEPDKREPEA